MPGTNLTREEAAARAALLTIDAYDVGVDLTTSTETFATSTRVRFSCTTPGADSHIDFVGDSVETVRLNGVDLDPARVFADSRIALPGLAADNELEVRATGRYMHTGEGLHRFVDPVDDEVYLYTQFETADSRRMFPVFEQPDLKASFAFTVTAPAHWKVISVQTTPEPTPLGERDVPGLGRVPVARWEFTPTPRLSSYVTALVAGPYDEIRDHVRTGDREVPLGLFCRRSLTGYLDADELFEITKRGFAFYADLFALPYPFEKYDQIFTPEYNAGAMENVGAVTYNEMYVFRAKVTDAIVERRALTVLHELAHMWFGNLVTMRWWDDLWLNESFAEWASMTCQAEATAWREAWSTFALAGKAWALNQDQLSSTHPVAADIRHLADVEANFDGITYAKGASALKQLVAYVGREPFVAGLRAYFAEFAYGNTTLDDLLGHLERTSGRDLRAWSRAWLETSGPNTLTPDLAESDGVVTAAAVLQTAPEAHPTLRPHRIAIGLYDVVDGALTRTDRLEIDVAGGRTDVPALVGRPRPALVLLNDDDLTYAKVRLDERSRRTMIDHVATAAPLPRAVLFGAAWDMTRDGEMSASDCVDLILALLGVEDDSTLLRLLHTALITALRLYTDPVTRDETTARAADRVHTLARAATPGSDAQLQLVTLAAQLATGPAQLDWVAGLYDGRAPLEGLTVDTEMRWGLLTALAAGGRAGEAEIAAEEAADATATGRERAATARAALPTAQAKADAWARVFDDAGLTNQMLTATLLGFMRAHDTALLEPYAERFLASIRGVWDTRTYAIAERVVLGAYPSRLASPELLTATEEWLAAQPADSPEGLMRFMRENRDGVARAVRAQRVDAGGR